MCLLADIVAVGQSSFLHLHFRTVGSTVARGQRESEGKIQLSATCDYVDGGIALGDAETAPGGGVSALGDEASYSGGVASGRAENASVSVEHTAHATRLFQHRCMLMVDEMLVESSGLDVDALVIAHTVAAEANGRSYGDHCRCHCHCHYRYH